MNEGIPKFEDLNPEEKRKERMETKLYVARDIEGEPNREELEIVRKIEKELSVYPAVIGIEVFGSVVGGYGNEESDIDIRILYDNSKFEDEEAHANFLTGAMKNIFPEWRGGPFVKDGKEIHFVPEIISADLIVKRVKTAFEGRPEDFNLFFEELASITGVVTGKKIDLYRKKIQEKLMKELSGDQQKKVAEGIIANLEINDTRSLEKKSARMPELSNEDHQEILKKRKEMWKKRVQRIWEIE